MKKVLRENKIYLLLYLMQFCLVGIVLLSFSKTEIHLFLNGFHNSFFDVFFEYLTYVGDGLTIVAIAVVLLLISFRKTIIVGLAGAFSGLIAQFFKRIVFSDVVRPKPFFSGIAELYFVPGVDVHTTLSLPSGHTTSAFALFFVLCSFVKNKYLKALTFIIALLTGYSRIYLSQHFLIDVYFGAFIGTISAIIVVYLLNKPNNKWIDKSLLKLFPRNE